MTETLPQLALKAKALAYRNRSRRNWVWLGGVLSGIAASACWVVFFSGSVVDPKTSISICVALGLAAAALALLAGHKTFFPETAKCPSCGYGWELREGRYVPLAERMETWEKCPGCGLPMSDFLLERALQGKP